jgi:nucleotide-binding universal stress UspA family protein
MFQNVLVPVDFTPRNQRALDAAAELAAREGGSLLLLHVIETLPHLPFSELKGFYKMLTRIKAYQPG